MHHETSPPLYYFLASALLIAASLTIFFSLKKRTVKTNFFLNIVVFSPAFYITIQLLYFHASSVKISKDKIEIRLITRGEIIIPKNDFNYWTVSQSNTTNNIMITNGNLSQSYKLRIPNNKDRETITSILLEHFSQARREQFQGKAKGSATVFLKKDQTSEN